MSILRRLCRICTPCLCVPLIHVVPVRVQDCEPCFPLSRKHLCTLYMLRLNPPPPPPCAYIYCTSRVPTIPTDCHRKAASLECSCLLLRTCTVHYRLPVCELYIIYISPACGLYIIHENAVFRYASYVLPIYSSMRAIYQTYKSSMRAIYQTWKCRLPVCEVYKSSMRAIYYTWKCNLSVCELYITHILQYASYTSYPYKSR